MPLLVMRLKSWLKGLVNDYFLHGELLLMVNGGVMVASSRLKTPS